MVNQILVIGVGNEFRGDDAVGIRVARRLAEMALPGITVLEQSGEGADLMAAWEHANAVLLIDAAQSGAEPGTIYRFDAQETSLPAEHFSFSSHAFGVAEAIEMARVLGNLPEHFVVYGIEGRNFRTGEGLCHAVEQSIETVIQRLLNEIQQLTNATNYSPEQSNQ